MAHLPVKSADLYRMLFAGSLAILILGIEPMLLSALVGQGKISESTAGTLVTVELLTIAVGTILGPRMLASFSAGAVLAVSGLGMVIASGMGFGLDGAPGWMISRALAGIFEGMAISTALVAIACAAIPERASGMYLALQTGIQMLAIAAAPRISLTTSRADILIAMLVISGLIVIALAPGAPRRLPPPASENAERKLGWRGCVGLLCAGTFMGAMISSWSYLGLWVTRLGLSAEVESNALVISLVAQGAAAALAAKLGPSMRNAPTIVGASLLLIMVLSVMIMSQASAIFATMLIVVLGVLWIFTLPAFTGWLIELDPSRQAAVTIVAAQMGGAASVPFLAGLMVKRTGLDGAFYCAIAVLALTILLVAFAEAGAALRSRAVAR